MSQQPLKHYKPKEFAALVGVSVKTLQRWDRVGTLTAGRTITGQRVYSDAHLRKALEVAIDARDAVMYDRIKKAKKHDGVAQG